VNVSARTHSGRRISVSFTALYLLLFAEMTAVLFSAFFFFVNVETHESLLDEVLREQ